MPLTRAQEIRLFNTALARVRAARSSPNWTGAHEVGNLTRDVFRALQDETPGLIQSHAQTAVRRAIAANALGREMTANAGANDNPVAHDYPHRPVLDARRGRYEYRVVVRGTSGRRSVEEVRVIQSRERMSGQEVIEQARQEFEAENANWDRKRGTDPKLKGKIRTEGFIISAIRMQPGR